MTKLRIGVYAIALNESQFAERWATSAADADYRFVADTGSTDDTVQTLRQHAVTVESIAIKPFRFDDARNAAMSLLPSDLNAIIALDMDEVLVPDWRQKMEEHWIEGCTRFRYRYTWSWARPGVPDVVYYGDKICGRHTHRWCHPVHEVLSPTVPEVMHFLYDDLIEHHPDNTKPRSQYLPLLELAVKEMPQDDRNAHYLGREYFFHGRYDDAIKELTRHLDLPNAKWKAERAASMRFIAKCYEHVGDVPEASYWYSNATFEDTNSKEALIDAAKFALSQNAFYATLDLCQKALNSTSEGGTYLNERYALAEGPYDLSSVAHYHLGNTDKAIELAKQAIAINPHDERLKKNLQMMSV
jgi:glycosyltransferase involved in cell wall biosynthesis